MKVGTVRSLVCEGCGTRLHVTKDGRNRWWCSERCRKLSEVELMWAEGKTIAQIAAEMIARKLEARAETAEGGT